MRCGTSEVTMPLIELHGVGKTYNGTMTAVRALHAVDAVLDEGEFVALTGPSGSGKSTLLGIVGAMTPPSSGRVLVDGIDVYALSSEQLADFRREYLGFVFQQLFLVPYLSAMENVMLPLAAAGMADPRQRSLARAALERVGLGDKTDRLPCHLSGGEQQRVAIARAIVNRPPLLLADEPTGCLDTATGRDIIDLFRSLCGDGLTILMVTHDPAVASRADRIVQLRDGAICESVELAVQ
jgi:putative ABC transport system ATP-binding protein